MLNKRENQRGASFDSGEAAVKGELIIGGAAPFSIRVIMVILSAFFIRPPHDVRRLLWISPVFLHDPFQAIGFLRVDKDADPLGMIPQNIIRAAAYQNTGTLCGLFPNNFLLYDIKTVVDRQIIERGCLGSHHIGTG